MSETNADLETLVNNAEFDVMRGNIQELISIYQQMDKLGAWKATARIGELYETGFADADKVFQKNLDEAAKWYRKSIFEIDDPVAHLGMAGYIMVAQALLSETFVWPGSICKRHSITVSLKPEFISVL